jgi:hypothetical protein
MSSAEPGPTGRESGNGLQRLLQTFRNLRRERGSAGRGSGAQREAGAQLSDAPLGVRRPRDRHDHQPAMLVSAVRGLGDRVQRWWRVATRRGPNDQDAPRTSQDARSSFSSGTDRSRESLYNQWGEYQGHYSGLEYNAPSRVYNRDESRAYGDDPRLAAVYRERQAERADSQASRTRNGFDFER